MAIDGGMPKSQIAAFDVLFGPITRLLSLFALTISFFLPPDGLGIRICWIQALFGVDCPGCGLTRSVTCISQLEFAKAWRYHPFGFLVYVLFVSNAVVVASPELVTSQLRGWLDRNQAAVMSCYLTTCGLFLGFGILRMVSQTELWMSVIPH